MRTSQHLEQDATIDLGVDLTMIETRGERLWRHAEVLGFGVPSVSKRVGFDLVVLRLAGVERRDLRGAGG